MSHIKWPYHASSATVLLERFRARPHPRMGRLATKFQSDIGSPSALLPPLPPHQPRSPLDICVSLPGLRKNADTPGPVWRRLVAERIADFERCIEL